jgi:hypothetical protein
MRLRNVVVAILAAGSLSASAAPSYHGFAIDQSARPMAPAALASLNAQLDMVEAAGLPPAVLAALKSTPIIVDPDLRGNPGIFAVRNGAGAVYVQPLSFPANKPILLHELLHAYHFGTLGLNRPEIIQTYQRVRDSDLFPPQFRSAHFLENGKEFFAVTGTLYLFGDIQQPPFSCTALAKLGDDYLAFLAAQFGPHVCKAGMSAQ